MLKTIDNKLTKKVKKVSTRKKAKARKPKIGLALSCGAAKGLAHVGVIQELEEKNIKIDAISGCSMGAYVGSLWAKGCNGKELEALAAEIQSKSNLLKLADPVIPPLRGLVYGKKARNHLNRTLEDITFEELKRDLLVVAANLDNNERKIFRTGSVADAVHASCAMPGIIAPVRIGDAEYVDGGIIDPVPISPLRKFAKVDKVIAVSVIPDFEDLERCALREIEEKQPGIWGKTFALINRHINLMANGNIVDILRRSIIAAQIRLAHESIKNADVVIKPIFCDASWHDYQNFQKYIDLGRCIAEESIEAIKKLSEPIPVPDNEKTQIETNIYINTKYD